MKNILLFTCLFAFCFRLFAQDNLYTLGGTVTDSATNKPLELATLVLKTSAEQKLSGGIITEADGKFLLKNISAGKYELTITLVGYRLTVLPLDIRSKITLGAVKLSSESKTLGEAVVTSQKSLIVKNSEKTIFNVAQSPINQTGTAEDVLRNMPGVSVDQKGIVSIIGKQGVKVLVDGRPNAMAQNDLPAFLKSIPANSIEAIELITNPSARYDADGNAGIINIKLKKGKADGLNGSVSAGYGVLDRYNGNFSINYRKNKINVFGNLAANASKFNNLYIENRNIGLNDTITYYNMNSKSTESRVNSSAKAGLDYFIDDKNTLTYTVGGTYTHLRWISNTTGDNFDAAQEKIATYNSVDDERHHNFSVTNDIAYRKKFDSTDRELDIDINHTYVNGANGAGLNSLAYDTTGAYDAGKSLYRRTQANNGIHNVVFQLDYIHPFKKLKGYKIEIGAKNETTLNKNVFDAYKTVNNVELADTLLSNRFNYTENIAAAYVIMAGSYKKVLSYSAGLRAEHTYISSNNTSVNKNYVSLFPSGTVEGDFSETQSLSASYSRRIQRPEFRQINNSISYIDQYSTWQGNSYLRPAFSHIVSVNYTVMVKKHMFSLDAAGTFLKDGFTDYTHVDSSRISRGGNVNGDDSKSFSITFYTKLQITKWWDFQMNHNYSYTAFAYKPGVNLNASTGNTYNIWAATSFKFWKNAVFEINGWFNTGGHQTQGRSLPVGMLNASIKKSFFKDKFTVAIAGNNILESMKWRWVIDNTDLHVKGSWQSFNRTVMLTLSYRFGTGKPEERKERDGNSRLGGDGKGR